jgi:alkylglycerol monooxygenase
MDLFMEYLTGLKTLFFAINPYTTMFEKLEDLPSPNLIFKATPYFFMMMLLEQLTLKLQGKPVPRVNHSLTNVANGALWLIKELLFKSAMYGTYIHLYENYRICALPWDSIWTWIAALVGYDFAYYWVHRALHEVNIFWAAHQLHHSSEEYNVTTAFRLSVMQEFYFIPFVLPMAFFVPPTHLIIHAQYNYLHQFWIHTEVIRDLGPLEYVLNTAKHHRVHHGSNRYCLDKNYAGIFIIWDRMFGTFEWEREDEKIVYGLVDQPQFFNPLRNQFFYYKSVWDKAQSMDNWSDWISAFVKGPGWTPGSDRLGDYMLVAEVQERDEYNPWVPTWVKVYAYFHGIVIFLTLLDLARLHHGMEQNLVLVICGFMIWSLTSVEMVLDTNEWCWLSEVFRSAAIILTCQCFGAWEDYFIPLPLLNLIFVGSGLIVSGKILKNAMKPAQKEAVAKKID